MTKHEYYITIAKAVCKKSTCLKKHYGAVIVKDDRIVATGYNGAPCHEAHCTTCTKIAGHKDMDEYFSCPAVHAEMNAIINASKDEMQGAILYLAGEFASSGFENISAEPCEICLRLIKNSGIAKVINSTGIIYTRDSDGILRKCAK